MSDKATVQFDVVVRAGEGQNVYRMNAAESMALDRLFWVKLPATVIRMAARIASDMLDLPVVIESVIEKAAE